MGEDDSFICKAETVWNLNKLSDDQLLNECVKCVNNNVNRPFLLKEQNLTTPALRESANTDTVIQYNVVA